MTSLSEGRRSWSWSRCCGWTQLAAVGALALALASADSVRAAGVASCVVVGVDDAATLRLQCGAERQTLRLAAVRAPRPGNALEGGEPFGTTGRDLMRGWFLGRRLEVGGGTARLGGEDVRRGLLALGLVEWIGDASSPAAAGLRSAGRQARLASRGLWSHDAWRRHQASVREPLLVPGVPLPPADEPLGAVAARLSSKDLAQRRAAFDAAVAQLEAQQRDDAAADPPPR